ncbi:response regulator [Bacillus sp. 165]|uniref:response regulator n=1 Tax=Bacillus sp. 165 TaxID=1529117 RepID=UPI001ADCE143|nr:response regulator [Bacillus sp. 165]MBO9128792.1 response regulator [Bacillus sp. 165]
MQKTKAIEVLIVEDDIRIAEIHRHFVEKLENFQVIGIATDEEQAKEQVRILQPDLILLDNFFPDMNGLEFLRYIQQHYGHIDTIMITAAKEINTVSQAIRAGVFDFIVKPLIFERFQATLLEYQSFYERLYSLKLTQPQVSQEEIDLLLGKTGGNKSSFFLPKGIDKLTLDKVLLVIKETEEGMTAERVGKKVGVSRTTARRYLEYLVSEKEVAADLSYGMIGRPERVYILNQKNNSV